VLRKGIGNPEIDLVAVNDLTEADTLAYLLKFDSVHGTYPGEVEARGDALVVDGHQIRVFSERDPAKIPWRSVGVELVIESTGRFENRADASKHLQAGAHKVIITAPAKGVERTLVYGVNEQTYDPAKHDVVAMGSCTTYALAPTLKVLDERFGIKRGFINTTHAYTNTQALLDHPVDSKRRCRSAAINLVPTTTGAARAIGEVLPQLKGKMDGLAVRAPVPDGSILDTTCVLDREVTVDEVNQAFREAAHQQPLGQVLRTNDEQIVSTDVVGTRHSAIVDTTLTMASGDLVKVFTWYDNEAAFALRVVDLAAYVARRMPVAAR
jgi:glyceraldehyde 3-phosphate dehydrogenase